MNWGRTFGFVLTGLYIAGAVGYLAVRDWRRAIYFALAAGINFTVVY